MRRHRTSHVIVAVIVTAAASAVAAPAQGATNVCTGQGTATTGALVYPVTTGSIKRTYLGAVHMPLLNEVTVEPPRGVGFSFGIQFGACAPDLGEHLSAGGWLTGWCGHTSGYGTTSLGRPFGWVEAGSIAVLTGGLTGIAHVTADPLAFDNRCETGATRFLVTYALVSKDCGIADQSPWVFLPVPYLLFGWNVEWIRVSVHTGPTALSPRACA